MTKKELKKKLLIIYEIAFQAHLDSIYKSANTAVKAQDLDPNGEYNIYVKTKIDSLKNELFKRLHDELDTE